ncbi:MAG: hypothetical protein K5753_01460 [Clostridia bacterium]|nr:hypothetical protein [Clostridia bacterium]
MELSQANDYVKKMLSCEWVKWIHPGSMPAKTAAERKNYAENPAVNTRHCASCLNMNGCCFVKGNCPENPLHEHCHCYYEEVGGLNVQTRSAIEKYTKYVFNQGKDKGKKTLFEEWGFSIINAETLKKEIDRQAQIAFQCGEYVLGKRDGYGQRINIVIHLKTKDTGETVSFVSGWMAYPDGELVLATPYGGKK